MAALLFASKASGTRNYRVETAPIISPGRKRRPSMLAVVVWPPLAPRKPIARLSHVPREQLRCTERTFYPPRVGYTTDDALISSRGVFRRLILYPRQCPVKRDVGIKGCGDILSFRARKETVLIIRRRTKAGTTHLSFSPVSPLSFLSS